MKAYLKVLGLGLVGSLLATACVITTDSDGGFDFDDDGGIQNDSGSPDGGGIEPVDAAADSTSPSTPDADAAEDMCIGPSGNACADCVTTSCLPEFCECDADSDCGTPVEGELACMNECMQDKSDMGSSKDDALLECGDLCAINGGILADSTNDLLNCMFAGVPDPQFADAGFDGGLIAVCGDICFGYSEPSSE